MKKSILVMLAFVFQATFLPAQVNVADGGSFSLPQAIEYASSHQKEQLNAELDVKIAKAKVKETTGIGLPQIAGTFDMKNYLELNFLFPPIFPQPGTEPGVWTGFPIETPSYSATAGITASQLLFDGSYIVGLKASKTYREFSEKNLTRSRIDLVVAVSKAYYNLLVNRKRAELVTANVTRLKKLRDDTKAMYDNGFVEKIDMDRVNLTYNNVVTEKEKIDRLIELSEFYLKFQMGMDIRTRITLSDSLNSDAIKNFTVAEGTTDVKNRIEYSLMQTQQRLLELDLQRNRAQYLPSLVLYGSVSTAEQRPKFDVFDTDKKWYPTALVGATLSMPVFSGLQKHYRVKQAQLSIQKMRNEIEHTSRALDMESSSAKSNLLNAIATLTTQEKNLELAGEVYRVSKLKYDQGVGSNLEVINAETSLKEAQTNYYNSMYEALVAKVDLDKAMGSIK